MPTEGTVTTLELATGVEPVISPLPRACIPTSTWPAHPSITCIRKGFEPSLPLFAAPAFWGRAYANSATDHVVTGRESTVGFAPTNARVANGSLKLLGYVDVVYFFSSMLIRSFIGSVRSWSSASSRELGPRGNRIWSTTASRIIRRRSER